MDLARRKKGLFSCRRFGSPASWWRHAPAGYRAGADDWITRSCLDKRKWRIVLRNETESVSFVEVHRSEFGLTDPRRVLQYRLEHQLQFAGRARNDLQHVGSGG